MNGISSGYFYCPYIPLFTSPSFPFSFSIPPTAKNMSQDKELQADFYKKIVDFCTKAIEPDFRFHITFGKTIYNLENSWQHLRTVDFRNLGLILLVSEKIVSNEITMGILDKNDVFVSLSEPQIIKLEQCLNMIFVKIEDITETTIEEFTNGNFTYFEV